LTKGYTSNDLQELNQLALKFATVPDWIIINYVLYFTSVNAASMFPLVTTESLQFRPSEIDGEVAIVIDFTYSNNL